MAGNMNSDSVIWVVGEATGVDGKTGEYGEAIPADIQTAGADTQTELDALQARLVASGVLPN